MLSLEALIVAVLLLAISVAFCFGGYKWFMILLPILAFLDGFFIGVKGVYGVYGFSILAILVIIVAGLIVGLILATVAYLFFSLAIILLGASFGYTVGLAAAAYLGIGMDMNISILGLIIGAIAGFFAFRFNLPKYFIIFFTALLGSEFFLLGTLILFGFKSVGNIQMGMPGSYISQFKGLILFWLILAIAGILTQLHR